MSHRLPLALKAIEKGYTVALASDSKDFEEHKSCLEKKGIKVFHVPFDRAGMNPMKDLQTLRSLHRVMEEFRPDIVHNVAMKPILYGSLLAKGLRVPKIINAIAGFGSVFSGVSAKARLLKGPMTIALKLALRNTAVIVQNYEDRDTVKAWIRGKGTVNLILGAGVDCDVFTPAKNFPQSSIITFVSRMLWSKGVGELVEAARMLKQSHPNALIQFVGEPDLENPDHVPEALLQTWHDEGVIQWLGKRSDIAALYQKSQIAVLPSYREGLPKSLLEACACGVAIVTTDVPGCREVVEDGVNGRLVPAKNAQALYRCLSDLLNDPIRCEAMGRASRERALKFFESDMIQEETIKIYNP